MPVVSFVFFFLCASLVLNKQWQIEGEMELSLGVDMYIIDLFGKGAGSGSSSFVQHTIGRLLLLLLLLLMSALIPSLPLSINGTNRLVQGRHHSVRPSDRQLTS